MDSEWRELVEFMNFAENVTAKLHRVQDETEIYRTVAAEFAESAGYDVIILLLTHDGTGLTIAATSLPLESSSAAEKATGLCLQNYCFDLDDSSTLSQVVRGNETLAARSCDILEEWLPHELVDVLSQITGCQGTSSVLTPLRRHGRITGALAIRCAVLDEHVVPAVKNLAEHISTALQQAAENAAHKRLEKVLQGTEDVTALILRNIPVQVVYYDMKLRVLWANKGTTKSFGSVRPEDLMGRHCYEVWRQLNEPCANCPILKAGETGQVEEGETTSPDGRVWHSRGYPVRDAGGSVVGVVEIAEDITNRKRVELELRQNEAMLEALLNALPESAFLMDTAGTVLAANETLAQRLGTGRSKLVGSCIYSFLDPDVAAARRERAEQVIRSGEPLEFEDVRTGRSMHHNVRPLFDAQGQVVRLAIVGSDITDRKRTESQLMRTERMASLGMMAGGIAHQLRNPLGIVSACSQLLLEVADDPQLSRQCVEKIYAATTRASRIIQGLLQFARPEGAPMAELELGPVLEAALISTTHQLALQEIKLEQRLQPCLPKVVGNGVLLQQVFANVIWNAIQAMPHGGALCVAARVGEARSVEIEFHDTGVGIPAEALPSILDPFFTTTPVGAGVGLGLAISHDIIQQHGGTIDIQSQVDEGTVVTIRLPLLAGAK